MKASRENPVYSVYVVDGDTKYNLTPVITSLDFTEQKEQLAQSVTIGVANIQFNGKWLTSILKVRMRVFIYADDGTTNEEVFRGYVWTRTYKSGISDRDISLKCYDNLIYFQESEESEFFQDGKTSKDVVAALCEKWGVTLEYNYESITHSKLALRGTLADLFTADILDLVKDRTGKKYVIRSAKDVMQVLTVGQNSTIYHIKAAQNAVTTRSECTMEGMTTKVVILGKADDNDREPVEATVLGKTEQYGTLQAIINRDENTSLADAKKEAQGILDNEGSPKWEYEITAPDIPWIRKGDKVLVNAGDISNKELIVWSVSRSIDQKKKKMTLTMEKP